VYIDYVMELVETTEAMMTENNHPVWFLARQWSFTSSTCDRLLVPLKNIHSSMLESIGFDSTSRSSLEMVLSYISRFKMTECVIHTDSEEMTTIWYNVSLMRQDEAHVSVLHTQLANNELPTQTI
jgi:hypothetical protein